MALVLIIDDSPTEVHVLKSMVEKNGFDTATAASGEIGLSKAKDLKPDLILMDIVMPGVNGFQATRQLRNDPTTAGIPVIMVSTKDQATDRMWGLRQGAVDYLVKPVEEKTLLSKMRAVLASPAEGVQ
ncbi:MAG: response regulator [Gammaproteobacteria bacterium]|nr:response regulator [Gammaproteobacteria bacterium]